MSDEKEKLLKLVNSSGFPFQLRVADQIRRQDPMFSLELLVQEHPWRAEDGREGFIDIVIRNRDADRLVLECKRTRGAEWVFLVPKGGMSNRGTQARTFYVSRPWNGSNRPPEKPLMGWHNFQVQPDSPVSEFCIVRGTGDGQKPMLENLCGILLNSVECLAQEELTIAIERNTGLNSMYIPVIVTNASLQVCRFELPSISLDDGQIQDGEFESVPYIRFSKSLSTKPESASINTIADANRARQRTVFVVQATQLEGFLQAWHSTEARENQEPWN